MRRLPLTLACMALAAPMAQARPTAPPLPPVPLSPAPTSELLSPVAGPAQALDAGAALPAHWWEGFGSARLNALVAAALVHANDIASAEAALHQAQEQAKATAGTALGPQVDASFSSQRTQISQALSNPLPDPSAYTYTLHTAQVTASMPLDVFGGGRAKVRSARAAAEAAGDHLMAARATVVSNLVQAVIQYGALAAQIAATQDAITADRQVLELSHRRQQIGDLGLADVAIAAAALGTAQVALPPLQRQLTHQQAVIAIFLGEAPGATPDIPELSDLTLPNALPVSLPAAVIAQRPDVRAAAAQLRGAAADLGVAAAARWPSFALNGDFGGLSTQLGNLLAPPFQFFSIAGMVTQPIFHSGALLHQKHAAAAALEAAKVQYRATATQAMLDVDDALSGLRSDATALDAAARADDAAERSFTFGQRQAQLGAIGNFQLASLAATAHQADVALVQARASRLSDTVALYYASGAPVVP